MRSTATPNYKIFRNLLVQARNEKKLTQVKLAARLNKSQSFITKYELGERRLDMIEFLEIVEALKINPVSFLGKLQREIRKINKRKH